MANSQQRNKTAFEANAKMPVSKSFETEFGIETDVQAGKLSQAQKEDQNSWYAGE